MLSSILRLRCSVQRSGQHAECASMSSVAVVNGQPRDPSSATPKENSQTPGPPPPVPPPNQTGATVSQSQSSQSQIGSSAPQPNSAPQRDSRRSEIYSAIAFVNICVIIGCDATPTRYSGPKPLFAAAWANKNDRRFRLAVGSIVEREQGNNNKSSQFTAPLTNFDWNEVDPRLIGTSSIDTTCTIYDIEAQQAVGLIRPITFSVKTQLIAHDKPVHDIAFSRIFNGKDNFATVGADGSARMFDLRHLEHSTIVYEDPLKLPLMRVAWNKQEHYHLATFAQDSTEVIIIDIRMPCSPLARLKNHNGAVNGLAWAPHSAHHICTASDDAQALIWDLQNMPRPVEDPILAYSAGGEVNQVHWGPAHNNWICICFNKSLEILRV
ncbi:WD domain, G-beta repeat protein [Ancylostoma ceylanicum]|uniref:WD domain, G-beta repeat protein n=1 Tax=Ancylostoma ceylanicum TaxID=53326 RepID=A0A0D6LX31_9BILA|nr:WD domain, G-beta repeat protein [Ancylostoma ceylanicum]